MKIDAGIDLLIGTNASKVLEPWEVVDSQGDGPYAVRTLLGWVIYSPLRGDNIRDENGCPVTNETKRFRTFVANRISFVRDTNENPADEASRGLTANRF